MDNYYLNTTYHPESVVLKYSVKSQLLTEDLRTTDFLLGFVCVCVCVCVPTVAVFIRMTSSRYRQLDLNQIKLDLGLHRLRLRDKPTPGVVYLTFLIISSY